MPKVCGYLRESEICKSDARNRQESDARNDKKKVRWRTANPDEAQTKNFTGSSLP